MCAVPDRPPVDVATTQALQRMKPALVIFDCDGVLVDSERLSHQVLRQMLSEQGVTIGFDEAVQRFIGTSLPECLRRVAELLRAPLPEGFAAQFAQRTQRAFEGGLCPVPGVQAVLDALDAQGVPFCVASNGTHAKVNFTLGHTGLLARFVGRIFTAEDVAHAKPAPDLFLLAARTLGADPAHTTVVEDTPTGIRAARTAGMRAIGYAAMTPARQLGDAHAVVHTMAEVGRLLGSPA
jgi:HAD superfamily hydrolase (TIGR01509 family)